MKYPELSDIGGDISLLVSLFRGKSAGLPEIANAAWSVQGYLQSQILGQAEAECLVLPAGTTVTPHDVTLALASLEPTGDGAEVLGISNIGKNLLLKIISNLIQDLLTNGVPEDFKKWLADLLSNLAK